MACREEDIITCGNKYTTLLDLARQSKILSGETACFYGGIQVGMPFSGYSSGVDYSTVVSLGVVASEVALINTTSAIGTTFFDVANPNSIYFDPSFEIWSYNCTQHVTGPYTASTCGGESGYTKCRQTLIPTDICEGETGFTENLNRVWTDPHFSGATSGMTLPITNLSAETQTVGPFWTPTETGTTGDHIIVTQYTGYTITYSFFDIFPYQSALSGCVFTALSADTCSLDPSLGTGYTVGVTGYTTSFSGFCTATQENFSAGTLDYKGPVTYLHSLEDALIDNTLITKKLLITGGASASTIGYVLTLLDDCGTAGWVFNSASASTNTFVTSGVLDGSDDLILTYNTGGSVPPIDLSALRFSGNTSGSCIEELWVEIISGCSGVVTIGSEVQGGTSSAGGTESFAFAPGSSTEGPTTAILGGTLHNIDSGSTSSGVFGGTFNVIEDAGNSTIIGGAQNSIKLDHINSTIIGGMLNEVRTTPIISPNFVNNTIIGGWNCIVENAQHSGILFGIRNSMSGATINSVMAGGQDNIVDNSDHAGIMGGKINKIDGISDQSVIIGGEEVSISASTHAVIMGGEDNIISGSDRSVIAGGSNNSLISGATDSAIIGGKDSEIDNSSDRNFIGGGQTLKIGPSGAVNNSAIIGGNSNEIDDGSNGSGIIGGATNRIDGNPGNFGHDAIIVGHNNTISGSTDSVIIGGIDNIIDGADRTVILGGDSIVASSGNTAYVPRLNIGTLVSNTSILNLGLDSQGFVVEGTTGSTSSSFDWCDPVVMSGNTRACCIDLMWISTISGCSPVTIGSSLEVVSTASTSDSIFKIKNGLDDTLTEISEEGLLRIGLHAGGAAPIDELTNIYIGERAGITQQSSGSTYVGFEAAGNNTLTTQTGQFITAIGYQAGKNIGGLSSASNRSTFLGAFAGTGPAGGIIGDDNVAIGYKAGELVSKGGWNVLVGGLAAQNIGTGRDNVVIGYSAGLNLEGSGLADGHQNVLIGTSAGEGTAVTPNVGFDNVIIGYEAGQNLNSGDKNVIIGGSAGGASVGTPNDATDCVMIGYQAGQFFGGGRRSVLIGEQAGAGTLLGPNLGRSNVAIGYKAGAQIGATGSDGNTYIGTESGGGTAGGTSTSADNVAIGFRALADITDGNAVDNVVIGHNAMIHATGGIGNIVIGNDTAGTIAATSNDNILIGKGIDVDADGDSNVLRIGSGSTYCLTGDTSTGDAGTGRDLTVGRTLFLPIEPSNDNALTQVLARDSGVGEIKYRDVASIISAATSQDTFVTGGTFTGNLNNLTLNRNDGEDVLITGFSPTVIYATNLSEIVGAFDTFNAGAGKSGIVKLGGNITLSGDLDLDFGEGIEVHGGMNTFICGRTGDTVNISGTKFTFKQCAFSANANLSSSPTPPPSPPTVPNSVNVININMTGARGTFLECEFKDVVGRADEPFATDANFPIVVDGMSTWSTLVFSNIWIGTREQGAGNTKPYNSFGVKWNAAGDGMSFICDNWALSGLENATESTRWEHAQDAMSLLISGDSPTTSTTPDHYSTVFYDQSLTLDTRSTSTGPSSNPNGWERFPTLWGPNLTLEDTNPTQTNFFGTQGDINISGNTAWMKVGEIGKDTDWIELGGGGGGTSFSWSDPVVMTGNTSGDCITELWVSSISGCSPITIGSSIKSSNSTIGSDSNSFAFGDGHEINYGNNGAILGGSYCKIVGTGFGSPPKDNTIIGGGYNQMLGYGMGTIIRSGIFAGGWSGDGINNNTIMILGPGSVLQSVIVGGNLNTLLIGLNGGDIHNSIVIGGEKNIVGTFLGTTGNRSHYNCGIVGGSGNTISDTDAGLNGAVIIGGHDITAVVSNTVYVPHLNIDSNPYNDNALTQILVRDTDGTIKYRDASSLGGGGGTFTGNTSGDCITELWVSTISGCSTDDGVTVGPKIHLHGHMIIDDPSDLDHTMHLDSTGFSIVDEGDGNMLDVSCSDCGIIISGSSGTTRITQSAIITDAITINGITVTEPVTIDPYNNVGSASTITWDVSGTSTNYEATLTAATQLFITNVRNGDYGTLIVHQDATGDRVLTFGGGTNFVVNGGGGAPTLTGNANATDILSFTYNGTAFYWTVGNDYT